MKRILVRLLCVAFVVGATLTPSPVAATDFHASDRAVLEQFLTENGVSANTRSKLLTAWEAGEPWDSSREGVDPTSVMTRTSRGETTEVVTYPDGSILVTTLQTAQPRGTGAVSPMAIGGCRSSSSGLTRYRTDCNINASTGLITIKFRASYRWTYAVATDAWVASAAITKADNAEGRVLGGSFSDLNLSISRGTATKSSPAQARASMTVTGVGGWFGITAWLQLNVPCNGYTLAHTTQHL